MEKEIDFMNMPKEEHENNGENKDKGSSPFDLGSEQQAKAKLMSMLMDDKIRGKLIGFVVVLILSLLAENIVFIINHWKIYGSALVVYQCSYPKF
jgi:hypothetical protein